MPGTPEFANRAEAGRRLGARLEDFRDRDCVVLALPRGGVPVAAEIAAALSLPLDLMLVRKIGAPGNPEIAVGAIADGAAPQVLMNEGLPRRLRPSASYVSEQIELLTQEIARRRQLYTADRAPVPIKGKTVILVDDGVATGATIRVGLQALARSGAAEIVIAVPVAPAALVRQLREQAAAVQCLVAPDDFRAVGLHYVDFHQVTDDEVVSLMRKARS